VLTQEEDLAQLHAKMSIVIASADEVSTALPARDSGLLPLRRSQRLRQAQPQPLWPPQLPVRSNAPGGAPYRCSRLCFGHARPQTQHGTVRSVRCCSLQCKRDLAVAIGPREGRVGYLPTYLPTYLPACR
jgi:hypothetical protein